MLFDGLKHPKFEVTIKCLIFDKDGKLLFIKDEAGQWDLPGGRIDEGETIHDCITREIQEELGVKALKISSKPKVAEIILHDDHEKRAVIGFEVEVESLNFKPSEENVESAFVSKEEFDKLLQAYKGLQTIKDKLYD